MTSAAPAQAADGVDRLDALFQALLAADHQAAQSIVEAALADGWPADDVRLRLITPALHRIGDWWQSGRIGVADEHLATKVCEWLLFTVAGRTGRPPTSGGRAVVGCSQGEQHFLGAQMVANMLSERGWRVLFLGADTPVTAWSAVVRARQPDVAVVSTTVPELVEHVSPTLAAIRAGRPDCVTAVGGQAYARLGAAAVGADLAGTEPRSLPAALAERGL